jgi:prepilin-type N-terminal cleavage/methylation domain-containing protein
MSVTPAQLAGEESGFTLIELLVAIVAGVIVTGALFAILEVSVHQTSRVNDRVQASQTGRIAMTRVVDELHSACIAREFAPVLAKSKFNELRFVSAYGEEPVIKSTEAFEHRIIWAKTYTSTSTTLTYTFATYPNPGYLLDSTHNAQTTSTWPKFKFEENPAKTVRVSEYVYEQVKTKEEGVPLFKYFKYSTKATTGTEEAASSLTEIKPSEISATEGLTEAQAKTVAAVQITFLQAPADNYTLLSRSAELSSSVGFAFTSPHTEATVQDTACQ